MKKRLLSLFLSAVTAVALAIPGTALENSDLLISPLREASAFTDTAGTICESAAALCCTVGLMDGVDARHFYPTSGLTNAQIIVVSARLLNRLEGGDLNYFVPISLKGPQWWTPYDRYLTAQLPGLTDCDWYQSMQSAPTYGCIRENYFRLLAVVLGGKQISLPNLNTILDVPDCNNETLLRFYRWGVLQGKDAYGTLEGSAPLTRGAAAAMLARLIDPTQRLTYTLPSFELCRLLLDTDPETIFATLDGTPITIGEFMPLLIEQYASYNHSHFGAMMMEEQGITPLDNAISVLQDAFLCERLAEEHGISVEPMIEANTPALTHGITEHGRAWAAYYTALQDAVHRALPGDQFPTDRLPEVKFTDLVSVPGDLAAAVETLPYWGGTIWKS